MTSTRTLRTHSYSVLNGLTNVVIALFLLFDKDFTDYVSVKSDPVKNV